MSKITPEVEALIKAEVAEQVKLEVAAQLKSSAVPTPNAAKAIESTLTHAEVAKMVKREVPVIKDKKPTGDTKQVAVKADEVHAFAEYSDHVVVVTTDGQKLQGDKQ